MTRCELLAETLPIDISTYVRTSEVDESHWCHTTRKDIALGVGEGGVRFLALVYREDKAAELT